MRPLVLKVRAFGPYAGEEVFDFRKLENRSLFLIHGPTGAGKSTILDAMCFAIYGETSGGERDGKQMRSDHADPGLLTEVMFDFSLGFEKYRILRKPQQERPKKKGAGTTNVSSEATLWKRTGVVDDSETGTVIETRWQKVTEKIKSILGFRVDEFRQVVMLPQGQFRKLLSSDSKEREKILEVLFQTEMYRRIEEALKENARGVKENFDNLDKQKEFIFQQEDVKSVKELVKKLKDRETNVKTLKNDLSGLQKEEELAALDFKKAMDKLTRINERKTAEKELNDLDVILKIISPPIL